MSYCLVAPNDGVFVGCIHLGILHRPTRIAILLRELGGLVFGGRYLLGQGNAWQPHERQPVLDDGLSLVVGEILELLKHPDLEHQHRWKTADARPSIRRSASALWPKASRTQATGGFR